MNLKEVRAELGQIDLQLDEAIADSSAKNKRGVELYDKLLQLKKNHYDKLPETEREQLTDEFTAVARKLIEGIFEVPQDRPSGG